MKRQLNTRLSILIIFTMFFVVPCLWSSRAFSGDSLQEATELLESGRNEEAISSLEKHIKENPSDYEALMLLGEAYSGTGKYKKALNAYRMALRITPGESKALIGVAICYGGMGMKFEAIEILEQVVEGDPKNATAHYYLGVAYERVRSINKAWEQYQVLKNLDKKLADKLYKVIFW
ncbi:MAG: tetratricopeptide repeat protein [Deltaproteobacteria bacterium]|nr:tetratricopeptide repeat protein [Deltaproteobacteria bacterium]